MGGDYQYGEGELWPIENWWHYWTAEPATDCAGGFKSEGLGISLLESMESSDPTAIIGLPMIFVAQALRPYVVASSR